MVLVHKDEKTRATILGSIAIPIWASISLFTYLSGDVPPFQLVAMSFFVATLVGGVMIWVQGIDPRLWSLNKGALMLGVAGLFGYHFFFFLALRNAPVLEAMLVNYLWPLLIVLFSALLPARHGIGGLRWWHIVGAITGFIGAALVLIADKGASGGAGTAGSWLGYGAALAAAFVWSGYSVASRFFSDVPTQAVSLYCFVTMIAATLAHLVFEQTVWPQTSTAWLAVLMLGIGPVGGAFYFWDYGMKRGEVRLLGVLSYFVPLLSFLVLIAAGISSPEPIIWVAGALITAGAVLAARDKIFQRKL